MINPRIFLRCLLSGNNSRAASIRSMSAASSTSNQKTLFNDDFEYNLSKYLEGVAHEKSAEGPRLNAFVERYRKEFAEAGIKRLLHRDVKQFSRVIEEPSDLELQSKVLLQIIKDRKSRRSDALYIQQIRDLGKTFVVLDQIEMAQALWDDPVFTDYLDELIQNCVQLKNARPHENAMLMNLILDHMFLLCRQGKFESAVEFFTVILQKFRGYGFTDTFFRENKITGIAFFNRAALQGLAALLQLEDLSPDDVLEKALIFFKTLPQNSNRYRSNTTTAWLAYKAEDYGLAEEIISATEKSTTDTMVTQSIRIMIHCQLDRPEEAMEIIEATLSRFKGGGKKPGFSYQAMKSLAKSVSARGDEKLQQEFTDLCGTLDKAAEMREESIEELLLSPLRARNKRGPFSKTQDFDEEQELA